MKAGTYELQNSFSESSHAAVATLSIERRKGLGQIPGAMLSKPFVRQTRAVCLVEARDMGRHSTRPGLVKDLMFPGFQHAASREFHGVVSCEKPAKQLLH